MSRMETYMLKMEFYLTELIKRKKSDNLESP